MNFGQSFRLALKSLMTSKMRALLTMLGIIIGVAAVIVITSLGNGMQGMMNEQFDKLGANLIQVSIYSWGGSRFVTPEDMYALAEKYPDYIDQVSPMVQSQFVVRNDSEELKKTRVMGVSESYIDMGQTNMEKGRFLQYIDVARYQNVCVVGAYIDQKVFHGNSLGQTLSIQGIPFTIIGVTEAAANDPQEGGNDDMIIIPYGNALHMSGTSEVNLYGITSTSKDTAAAAKGLIEKRLFQIFQTTDLYFVMTAAEMMDSMNMMMNTMMVVLIAIAAISLLVGGIGIMNIMLVSVTERTREIGIRKSLGAKRRDIRGQFIIEAGTTSAIGGVLGIGLGIGLAQLVGVLIGGYMAASMGGGTFNAVPTVGAIGVAFGVSVGIGILFGYLPANKAAALNPIDALRYD